MNKRLGTSRSSAFVYYPPNNSKQISKRVVFADDKKDTVELEPDGINASSTNPLV